MAGTLEMLPGIYLTRAAAAALLAIAFAVVAIVLASGRRGRLLGPVGGGLLVLVALFGLLPELARAMGWFPALGLAAAGYAVVAALDRMGIPVCPSCSHAGGYLTALVSAVAVHALVDGWSMVAVSVATPGAVAVAVSTTVILHKVPEGMALGAMVHARVPGKAKAILLCIVAELPTVFGGALGLWRIPAQWVNYPLAVAMGTFLFLGTHAITSRRR